jgi:hypothetical protein
MPHTAGRRVRLVPLALLLAASWLIVPATPALAHHECNDVPNCVSISPGQIEIGRDGAVNRHMTCPSDASAMWGTSWDKSSLNVSVIDWPDWPSGASLRATNLSAVHRNTITFYLGCSASNPQNPPPGGRR